MYYMGFGYKECYLLPIWQRLWFIKRINDEIKRTAEANDGNPASKAAHHNDPNIRAMQGRSRAQVPAKLRRFT